jgi:alkylation response protein AidB-like acyl-CoA dehydrogenase
MWITNGSIADIAMVWASTSDGIRGFIVPRGTAGFTARDIHKKISLRGSITSELHLDEVRLPADAVLPRRLRAQGPAVVPDRGQVRHRLMGDRRGKDLPRERDRLRHDP